MRRSGLAPPSGQPRLTRQAYVRWALLSWTHREPLACSHRMLCRWVWAVWLLTAAAASSHASSPPAARASHSIAEDRGDPDVEHQRAAALPVPRFDRP